MILQEINSNKGLSYFFLNNHLYQDTSWKIVVCIGTSCVIRCRNFPPHLVATAIRCTTSLGIRILCRSLPKEPHFITSDGTIVHLLWQQTPLFISRKWVSLTYLSSTFMGVQSEVQNQHHVLQVSWILYRSYGHIHHLPKVSVLGFFKFLELSMFALLLRVFSIGKIGWKEAISRWPSSIFKAVWLSIEYPSRWCPSGTNW